jgi:toxin FitB
MRKMSPGDAIIAATALHFNLAIYTRNVSDFNWITGLSVVNPI